MCFHLKNNYFYFFQLLNKFYAFRHLELNPSVKFAWPFLMHFEISFQWLPAGVLSSHLNKILTCLLQLLNIWHLPLQVIMSFAV